MTNEAINIKVQAEGQEQAIILGGENSEQEIGAISEGQASQGIDIVAEGGETLIMSQAPEQEAQLDGIGNESIVVRNVTSYNSLDDKPSINEVTLIGDKSFEDLGAETLTNLEIESIINSIV